MRYNESMSNKHKKPRNERIYNAYRQVLAAGFRKHGVRAGARKQKAREIITERYNLTHSELKEIVRFEDQKNGITHDDSDNPFTAAALAWNFEAKRLNDLQGDSNLCPNCRRESDSFAGKVYARQHPITGDPFLSCYFCVISIKDDIYV